MTLYMGNKPLIIMKNLKNFVWTLLIFASSISMGQNGNLKTYTPSKLLKKGQTDVKIFANFYSETEDTFQGDKPRENYFTTTFEVFRGISSNARLNIGLVMNVKSNNVGGQSWFSPIDFNNEDGVARAGLTSIAPTISFQPFAHIGNLSIRSSIYIPLVDNETENNVYLDKKSWVWENKIFYDYVFPGGNYQIFTEIDTQLNLGEEDSYDANGTSEGGYANNSLGIPLSVFFSYFPTNDFTLYVQGQQFVLIDLGNEFSQEFTQVGLGMKYQITPKINLETSYTNFVRGSDTGLGETINFGFRYLSN